MVRSYLIEDRICFDSDSGSGGVSAPRRTEIRGQDHMLAYITPEEGTILKAFGGSGNPGPMGIPAYAEDDGDQDGSSGAAAGGADSDDAGGGAGGGTGGGAGGGEGSAQAGDTSTSDAETDDPATAGAGSTEAGYSDETGQMGTPGDQLGGYQGSTGPGFGGYAGSPFGPNQKAEFYTTPKTTRDNIAGLTRDQYNQMPGYMKAMMDIAPPIGYNIDEFGKVQGYISNPVGVLGGILSGINNTISGPPEDSKGLVDRGVTTGYGPEGNVDTENYDGGDGFDEFDDMRRRRRNSSGEDNEDTEDAPTVIDDFAVNYLRNPYFAYSGFGNQYNPYGYANSTLVDLLQTRGMTQPSQADTLGLFADPRDFR